jgi:hypothetical protein
VIVLLRVLIASDNVGSVDINVDLDRKFGLYLAFLAALGLAAGGFLKFQEEKKGGAVAGPSDSGPGTTPPTPF